LIKVILLVSWNSDVNKKKILSRGFMRCRNVPPPGIATGSHDRLRQGFAGLRLQAVQHVRQPVLRRSIADVVQVFEL